MDKDVDVKYVQAKTCVVIANCDMRTKDELTFINIYAYTKVVSTFYILIVSKTMHYTVLQQSVIFLDWDNAPPQTF